jgi:hypothetical protein
MPDARYLADQAERCRKLAGRTTNSYVSDQLRLWADDFETAADAFDEQAQGAACDSSISVEGRTAEMHRHAATQFWRLATAARNQGARAELEKRARKHGRLASDLVSISGHNTTSSRP